jgi:hypothetical protein
MKFDLCLPVYRNLECLQGSVAGMLRRLENPENLGRVILHIQDPEEQTDVLQVLRGIDPIVASWGPGSISMADILNRLFAASESEWVVFSEQDVFMRTGLDRLVNELDEMSIDVAGPVDTLHYSHPNARGQPKYGQYSRLSPEPGYFHSSLIFVRRAVAALHDEPFSLPENFRLHGYGVLGGETYYGLRVKLGADATRLAFFDQRHAEYGYAAHIFWGPNLIATHLYYSSTRDGYLKDGFLTKDEHRWLSEEEARFARDYWAATEEWRIIGK